MALFTTLLIFALAILPCFAQTASVGILDLLIQDEFRRAGLSKLSPQEMQSLNASLMRIITKIGTAEQAGAKSLNQNRAVNATDFFDSEGVAVAFFDDDGDSTLYLWSGRPVA